jgi:phytoene dehydrogenase-like protein
MVNRTQAAPTHASRTYQKLPDEDVEVSKEIQKQYKKLGIKVLTGTKVESIKEDGSQVTVAVSKDGKNDEVKADKVLQASWLRPQRGGLRAGQGLRAAHRPQGHRHRRVHAHQRAAHLRHWGCHRAAAAVAADRQCAGSIPVARSS